MKNPDLAKRRVPSDASGAGYRNHALDFSDTDLPGAYLLGNHVFSNDVSTALPDDRIINDDNLLGLPAMPESGLTEGFLLNNHVAAGHDCLDIRHDDLDIHQSASLPSSPAKRKDANNQLQEALLKGRCKHLSPLMGRKGSRGAKAGRRSSESQEPFMGEFRYPQTYQSLETFQKTQLRNKVGGLGFRNSRLISTRLRSNKSVVPSNLHFIVYDWTDP